MMTGVYIWSQDVVPTQKKTKQFVHLQQSNTMCGILVLVDSSTNHKTAGTNILLQKSLENLSYRGPDNQQKYQDSDLDVVLGFARLAIMDPKPSGNQPMVHPEDSNLVLVCNGEIYNFRALAQQYGFRLKSGSDCEIILHLYKANPESLSWIRELDGVYAFALLDRTQRKLLIARDPFGIRPLFQGFHGHQLVFGSEIKAIQHWAQESSITPYPPGTCTTIDLTDKGVTSCQFYNMALELAPRDQFETEETICDNLRVLLRQAVEKRMMSDQPIGCLLSGGLDSSLICALVNGFSNPQQQQLNTFSIGMPGSPDLKYAQMVADFLGTKHHHVEVTSDEFLKAIPKVIYHIESWDTTTVRASVGNFLIGQYIRDHTDIKVVFNGDGSDEMGGYLYFGKAPSGPEFHRECVRLLREIHCFDVLRSDRCVAENGLEARTPFLDPAFASYYMGVHYRFKHHQNGRMEKYLLRKAFEPEQLLPKEVLWRKKEAFSDGVSTVKDSWHTIIQRHVDGLISDREFHMAQAMMNEPKPPTKEAYWYRMLFLQRFPGQSQVIPHYWMPKWSGNVTDPSARVLDVYT
jgi:asparagine synthase (glutamine-hydrolysing)